MALIRRYSMLFGQFRVKRRLSKPREMYSRLYYKTRVRATYLLRSAGSKCPKGELLALRNTITDEIFAKEDERTKEHVKMLLDLEKSTMADPSQGHERTPLQLQLYVYFQLSSANSLIRCICRGVEDMPAVVQAFVDWAHSISGMAVSVYFGGAVSKQDGEITVARCVYDCHVERPRSHNHP